MTDTIAAEGTAATADVLLSPRLHRMESIGALAPGLAHEINTPIQFVGDSVYFLHNSIESLLALLPGYGAVVEAAAAAGLVPDVIAELRAAEEAADLAYLRSELPQACEHAATGVARIARLVGALQALARGSSTPAVHDLRRIVEDAIEVTRNETKYVADVETHLTGPLHVRCDGPAIMQVVVTLIVNAADSIRGAVAGTPRRGRIAIRLEPAADGVGVTVGDDGDGVESGGEERIFEPFYTTKEEAGRGRGLAVARAIARRHGGDVNLERGQERGATFRLSLPIAMGSADVA